MTSSSLLSHLASLLYGPHPLSALASHLHNPTSLTPSVDYRLVRRWAKGERPIPDWVWDEMRRLLEERQEEIKEALMELEEGDDLRPTSPIDTGGGCPSQ